jgi:hypothetical protein
VGLAETQAPNDCKRCVARKSPGGVVHCASKLRAVYGPTPWLVAIAGKGCTARVLQGVWRLLGVETARRCRCSIGWMPQLPGWQQGAPMSATRATSRWLWYHIEEFRRSHTVGATLKTSASVLSPPAWLGTKVNSAYAAGDCNRSTVGPGLSYTVFACCRLARPSCSSGWVARSRLGSASARLARAATAAP